MNYNCLKIEYSRVKQSLIQYKELAEIWVPVKSLKCNELFSLIAGSHYLVDSRDQVDFLLGKNIHPNYCFFGPYKSIFDLTYAISKGFTQFIVSSKYELDTLQANTSKIDKIFFMISSHGILYADTNDRFGFSLCDLDFILQNYKVKEQIDGISFHLQSPHKSIGNYATILQAIIPLCEKYGISKINLGGIPASFLLELVDKTKRLHHFHWIVEPGNSLFSDAISIETYVTYVDSEKKIINLNMGIYNGLLDCRLLGVPLAISSLSIADELDDFNIYGPSSDNLDFLGIHKLPKNIKPGNRVRITNCGIYSLFLKTEFYPSSPLRVEVVYSDTRNE